MRILQKPYAWAIAYTVLLFLFTLFVVLDTFVIPRAYKIAGEPQTQDIAQDMDKSTKNEETDTPAKDETSSGEAEITDNFYTDENISIQITEYREYDTSIYVADIVLSSPSYLKTALADNTYGRNVTEKTSVIAGANKAILAINGDYYGAQKRGYVIRNGTLYRDTVSDSNQDDLVIYEDGSMKIVTEDSSTADQLLADGAVQVLSFGPGLVENGEVTVTDRDEVDKAMASNPRTAIGIIDNLHYVLVVSDGRTKASTGISLYQLAAFLQDLGVNIAYNLDGGGSSTMYFNGAVVNNPTTNGQKIKERGVSDIVYIGY